MFVFMIKDSKPFILVILDGWGISKIKKGNAVREAHLPFFEKLWTNYPHTILKAAGRPVGLPGGQIGNSEAGHMNIGAGRVIRQDAVVINDSIADQTFFKNPAFLEAVRWVLEHKSHLHLLGLLTGIQSAHADRRHLYALLDLCKSKGSGKIYLHLFLDGRDSPPTSAFGYLGELVQKIKEVGLGQIVSMVGRFYAMDRIYKWERIQATYDNLTLGQGERVESPLVAIKNYYAQGITDEFIPPTLVTRPSPVLIGENDSVIFFNLRSDRGKELTQAFVEQGFTGFPRRKIFNNLCFVTMTEFDAGLGRLRVAYPARVYRGTLPEVIGQYSQYKQLYIAESEKFPHVTYFLNGGSMRPRDREGRVKIPSPEVKSYAEKPEMRAQEVTEKILSCLKDKTYNFLVVNYANPDMVGHTGNFRAAIRALEFLDQKLLELGEEIKKQRGTLMITSDHGNVEEMIDPKTGAILTSHTRNPVPFILADFSRRKSKISLKKSGKLANITPTILDYLGLPKPAAMTEESLIIKFKV